MYFILAVIFSLQTETLTSKWTFLHCLPSDLSPFISTCMLLGEQFWEFFHPTIQPFAKHLKQNMVSKQDAASFHLSASRSATSREPKNWPLTAMPLKPNRMPLNTHGLRYKKYPRRPKGKNQNWNSVVGFAAKLSQLAMEQRTSELILIPDIQKLMYPSDIQAWNQSTIWKVKIDEQLFSEVSVMKKG